MDFSLITQGLEAAALYLRFMAHIAYDAYILPSGGFSIASTDLRGGDRQRFPLL